jgi:hypothetical protein
LATRKRCARRDAAQTRASARNHAV